MCAATLLMLAGAPGASASPVEAELAPGQDGNAIWTSGTNFEPPKWRQNAREKATGHARAALKMEGALRAIPVGRAGEPSDMAGAAIFLASPLAAYVCGHTLIVDGGLSL